MEMDQYYTTQKLSASEAEEVRKAIENSRRRMTWEEVFNTPTPPRKKRVYKKR
jgi:hypothetical protein